MRESSDSPFTLDRHRLRRAFERAAASYDQAAVLQREIGGRLLERLDLIKLKPESIVDVGCGTGTITAALLKKYRKARVIGLETGAGHGGRRPQARPLAAHLARRGR
jgi:malonyl-CoA O-methyltransferase